MFERFTDRARRVVVLAQEEARRLNHNYIGTEHLLLGLLHEHDGMAGRALEALAVDLDDVRARVVDIIGMGEQPPSSHIPFTPRAKEVLELSLRESLQLGHSYIGTEHILLGLVREGQGVAAQVLVEQGTDLERVRGQVIHLLSESTAGEAVQQGRLRRRFFGGRPATHAGMLEVPDTLVADVGFEELADEAVHALLNARDEVRRMGGVAIEPEHLLLGLLARAESAPEPTARRLAAAGADLETLRRELDAVAWPPPGPTPAVPRPSAAAGDVLASAARLARGGPVGTEALLAALLAGSTGVRLALRAAGADLLALGQDDGGAQGDPEQHAHP